MTADLSLVNKTACEVLDLLNRGEVSPLDLLDTLEQRIDAVDGSIHALPTLCFDRAREQARALMKKPLVARGVLRGMPLPIKDLDEVAGVRTTYGSSIYREHIPTTSNYLVQQLESNGALVYAKSNTPEFGSGAQTFNVLFPTTCNPRNTALSVAGSSGGAAAALASGSAWLAQGSDMAGSLRTPASFCGVVGMRPSPGRVVAGPGNAMIFDVLSTSGPMARTVEDTALLLDAMCGRNPGDPLVQSRPGTPFRTAAQRIEKPQKIAFSADLGISPLDPAVSAVFSRALETLGADGIELIGACPDFSGVHETFGVLRAHSYAVGMESLLRDHRDQLKPDNVWNIERGLALTAAQIAEAQRQRSALFYRSSEFMQSVDALICPTAIVPSFPLEQRFVDACNGVTFDHYYHWLALVYAITLTALPAISIPCGIAGNGIPIGLQVIGKVQGEVTLLSVARYLETLFAFDTTPVTP